MHKLLQRQVKLAGGAADVPQAMESFMALVDGAYCSLAQDRAVLEHSMKTVSHDLSDRNSRLRVALDDSQRAQTELSGTLALLEATIESTTDALLVVDSAGFMVRMNNRFIQLWKIPESILAARDDAAALAFVLDQLEHPDEFIQKVEELYAHPDAESSDTLIFKDQRVVERFSKPQRVDGKTVGRVWSFRDVTAQRQTEAQLRQSQKMEAVGSLAGGVAHDFNNILTVITGYVGFLQQDDAIAPSHRGDLLEIQKAAHRATMLTRQLLAFSRKQLLHLMPLDLGDIVRELQPMLRRLIGEDIQIDSQLAPDATITADQCQLEQVLVNLAVNARDAMPSGGRLTIQTEKLTLPAALAIGAGGVVPNGIWVVLSVRDTGEGMPASTVERVFEPFFTTKAPGKGTGLGLATVYGIVKQCGGFIDVRSEVGMGTCFTIFLPAAIAATAPRVSAELPTRVRSGAGTVLVVEDEEALRQYATRVLEKKGYTVLSASTGEEALKIVHAHTGAIDLVLSDVVMPGMGGQELRQHLLHTSAATPVVFMSGYTDDEMQRRGAMSQDMRVIEKPFTADELTTAVHDALEIPVLPAATESRPH